MTTSAIVEHRQQAQGLHAGWESPERVVMELGAVQAQDFFGSLWAIGQRMKEATEAGVEAAIAGRKIIRTWPLRGTLHFVSPQDVHWMLPLLAPRAMARAQGNYRAVGLEEKTFTKSRKLWERALQGGKQLTRTEMYEVLEHGGIATADTRGLHLLVHAAMQGVICFAPRQGKQPAFTLLQEWIAPGKPLQREEALARLAIKYFAGHGPATLQDFAWWSGLSLTDAQRGLESVRTNLIKDTMSERVYWRKDNPIHERSNPNLVRLLPAFDEFLVAYKDRSATMPTGFSEKLKNKGDGISTSVICINGQVMGTWKRTLMKSDVIVEVDPFLPLKRAQMKELLAQVKRYGTFIGKQPVLAHSPPH